MKRFFLFFVLLLLVVGKVAASVSDSVLMTIGQTPISVAEFQYIYQKNNQNNLVNQKTFDEYLELFKNFKLKVIEAQALGYDTTSSFLSELNTYRSQLSKIYMTDKDEEERLLHEAYDRLKEDINVSHVLIEVPWNASPEDTLAFYKRAFEIYKRLQKEDFETVAREVSDDQSVAKNGGTIGYVTSLMTIYPFENAIYRLPIGKISMPIRTQAGYHLIRINERRPAVGEVHVAHIMKLFSPERKEAEKDSLKQNIDSIYSLLKNGANFSELAQKFSDDKQSALHGGDLSWFGIGRMVPEFEKEAFRLSEPGEISEPVLSPYGWHIIRLIEKRGILPFEQKKAEIQRIIERDVRAEMGKKSLIVKLKKAYNFTLDKKSFEELQKVVVTSTNDSSLRAVGQQMKKTLFSFADKTFTQNDFIQFLISSKSSIKNTDLLSQKMEDFVSTEILKYEDSQLEQKYPDFKNLVREYYDGILLFELSNQNVWEKASTDISGLELFFAENREKYKFAQPKFKGYVITCRDKKVAKLVKRILEKSNPDSIESYIFHRINVDTVSYVKVLKGLWSEGENTVVDQQFFKQKNNTKKQKKDLKIFLWGQEIIIPEHYSDVKGKVISDYQNYLDSKWIESLKKKYPIIVNEPLLRIVQKQ